MTPRVVSDDSVDTVVVSRTPVASIVANILTSIYTLAVGLIGLDTLLTALHARRSNGFVSFVDRVTNPLLAPFRGMFDHQAYWATALIAAVVYTVIYLALMAALRRDRVVEV